MVRLLVIEDEPKTAACLRKGLEENGFTVDVAGQGTAAEAAARRRRDGRSGP